MVFAPTERLLPLTVRTAVELLPDAARFAVPRTVFPRANLTLPVGTAAQLAAFTVAVNCVVAVEAIVVGLAATVVAVATGAGGVTLTDAEAVEFAKLPVAA
jgi:hypothetical protein